MVEASRGQAPMTVDRKIDEAVHRFYAAATGELAWQAAFDPMLDATGFDGAALYVIDRDGMTLDGGTKQIVRGVWHRLDPGQQDEYANHYFKLDPRMRLCLANPNLRILHDYLHTAESEIDRDPYYAWYLRDQPTRYYVGGQTDRRLPFYAGVTLHRRGKLGAVRPEEIERFGVLFDHLERALLVEHRLFRAARLDPATNDLVESNAAGVVLLDRSGRIVHANAAARAMAGLGDAIALSAGGLMAMRGDDNAKLQRAIGAALAGDAAVRPPPPITLPRRTGERDYIAIATTVSSRAGLFQEWAPAACVLIIDPARTRQPPEALLRRAFGLTAAEARVAALLMADRRIEDAASLLGVSLATVRTHVAALFRKTGTNRQAELIRLLASLPWTALVRAGV